MNNDQQFALRARIILPIESPPILDGFVTLCGDKIVGVSSKTDVEPVFDMGDVAILPGLVNAHTHLEFSQFKKPLGQPGMPLPDWIRQVVAHRRNIAEHQSDPAEFKSSVIAKGLDEADSSATVALGEIATHPWDPVSYSASGVEVTLFQELIGLLPPRIESILNLAQTHVELAAEAPMSLQFGLSPHAPYSVHPQLVRSTSELCHASGLPLAMHLAESREEIQLLKSGDGPFVEMLQAFDAWDPGVISIGSRPMDYLRQLTSAPMSLVIHGNYLDEEEIAFVARHQSKMKIVYCPRTHDFFQHEPYPLENMLRQGVDVALGTDSRASNPDLSLWNEIRAVCEKHPDISPAEAMRMGTLVGAKALGVQDRLGTISPGKSSRLAVVDLASWDRKSPHESVLAGGAPQLINYSRLADSR